MPPVTETEMKELRDLVLGLREEMRLGFAESKANTDVKFAEAKADTDAKFAEAKANTDAKFSEVTVAIANLSGDVRVLEERTKLGFWGFIGRALIISTFALAISFATKYFFFGNVKIGIL
jgi:hypothetical protein